MNNNDETFDIFADAELPEPKVDKSKQEEKKEDFATVEAIQVIRVIKGTVGKRREVVDTFLVSYPSMTYERASRLAHAKARILGNCMVVEKLERIVGGY